MKRTSTEAHVYTRRHQGANCKHFDVSNVIYHKISRGAASYTLSEENVNVMLELKIMFGVFLLLKDFIIHAALLTQKEITSQTD